MAVGDLIVGEDGAIEFGGWSTSASGVTGLRRLDGVESMRGVRSGNVPRGRAHGAIPGPQFLDERVITAEIVLSGTPTEIRTATDEMASAMPTLDVEQPLVWVLPGMSARRVSARVAERDLPVTIDYLISMGVAVVQFVATDPRIYADAVQTASTGPGSATGGLSFPFSFPFSFGTTTTGTLAVSNGGNTLAPWTATLVGPLTSPSISLVGTTGQVAWNGLVLTAGQTLEIDSLARTSKLNGTADRFPTARSWFGLPPGDSTVQLQATAGDGTLTLTHRDTWL